MKLSGVPKKAYNSRPSEFWRLLALCVHPRHPYIGASTDAPIPDPYILFIIQLMLECFSKHA